MYTCVYEVHFQDGHIKKLAANSITEVYCAQCDLNCNQYVMLDSIVDPDVAVSYSNQVKIVGRKKVVS